MEERQWSRSTANSGAEELACGALTPLKGIYRAVQHYEPNSCVISVYTLLRQLLGQDVSKVPRFIDKVDTRRNNTPDQDAQRMLACLSLLYLLLLPSCCRAATFSAFTRASNYSKSRHPPDMIGSVSCRTWVTAVSCCCFHTCHTGIEQARGGRKGFLTA